MTCATATASWIGAPFQPYVVRWYWLKKTLSSATKVPIRPSPRSCASTSGPRMALCVTSSPAMVTSRPLENTTCAASGSHQMLNSAAGVKLPSAIEPPMSTMRAMPVVPCASR
jgi:hypothetical protein